MTPVEKDDFVHALTTTMRFYNKTLDKGQVKVWFGALSQYPIAQVQRALDEYPHVGRYAPKPVDILDILHEIREREAANESREQEDYTPCPPEIQAAWMWFMGVCAEGSALMDGLFSSSRDVDVATADHYLRIVNEQAKLYNNPDAVPDEYKIDEVWA